MSQNRSLKIVAVGVVLLGILLVVFEVDSVPVMEKVEMQVMQPQLVFVREMEEMIFPARSKNTVIDKNAITSLENQVEGGKNQEASASVVRLLLAQNGQLKDQLHRIQNDNEKLPAIQIQDTERLFTSSGQTAQVIGANQAKVWNRSLWIDRGHSQSLAREELVVEINALHLDLGTTSRIAIDSPVLAGRAVVGNIRKTSAWTSTVRKVTDADFKGSARLLKGNDDKTLGASLGAIGSLHGTGNAHCQLKYIDPKERVSIGDHVLATDTEGGFQVVAFYGTVVRAELNASATEWKIEVKPACQFENLKNVVVINTQVTTPTSPHFPAVSLPTVSLPAVSSPVTTDVTASRLGLNSQGGKR